MLTSAMNKRISLSINSKLLALILIYKRDFRLRKRPKTPGSYSHGKINSKILHKVPKGELTNLDLLHPHKRSS